MAHHQHRSLTRRLHDYFLPHKGNGYKPHFFRTASVTAILVAVIVLEGAYLAQVHLVFPKTNFLASVLPGTLIALTNDDRAAADAPALAEDPTLDRAATLAAEDMASKGYFAHVSPSGTTPWDWLAQVGYEYTYAGENLAVNFTDSSAVESAWMASPTHHANIVKPQYTKVGVGVADGTYQGQQVTFVVQFFATPLPAVEASSAALAKEDKPTQITTVKLPVPVASQVPTTTTVLAASTTPPSTATASSTVAAPTPSLIDQVLTSPTHTSVLILSILAGLVLVLLIIAIVVKLQVQYLEVIGGGLLLLVVLLGLILFNIHSAPKVEVPVGAQDAATSS